MTVWIRTAPNTVPSTPPRPPNRLVPPRTAAATAANSFSARRWARPPPTWVAETKPATPASPPQMHVDRGQHRGHGHAGLLRGLRVLPHRIDLPAERRLASARSRRAAKTIAKHPDRPGHAQENVRPSQHRMSLAKKTILVSVRYSARPRPMKRAPKRGDEGRHPSAHDEEGVDGPKASPTARHKASAAKGRQAGERRCPRIATARYMTAPTDRSIPAVSRTKVMPMPRIAMWRRLGQRC